MIKNSFGTIVKPSTLYLKDKNYNTKESLKVDSQEVFDLWANQQDKKLFPNMEKGDVVIFKHDD